MTDQTFILNKKTSLHHSPAPLTIKKENGSPPKMEKLQKFTPILPTRKLFRAILQCKQTCRTKYNLHPT